MSTVAKKMMMGIASGSSTKTIVNSISFDKASAEVISKQFSGVADSRKKWTASIWYKIGSDGYGEFLGSTSNVASGNSQDGLHFYSNYLQYISYDYSGSGINARLITNTNTTLFGTNGDWHHLHMLWDTTQATASNRAKIYIDGTQITGFSTETYPALNYDGFFVTTQPSSSKFTGSRNLTSYVGNAYYGVNTTAYGFNGLLADVNVVDGLALPVDTFAEDVGGTWTPKVYTGSYGSNGFNLNMADGAFGTDSSGNGNDFTATNIATADVSTDVPPA